MEVKPNYCRLKTAFTDGTIFKVPTYQRAYSWKKVNVKQFCEDMHELYETHLEHGSSEHFLGGVVCVKISNEDDLDERNIYQLVDGQQRLSTLVLYFSRLIKRLNDLVLTQDDNEIRKRRIKEYEEQFINLAVEENNKIVSVPRITLSKRDKDFYQSIVSKPNENIEPNYNSHRLLNDAKKTIDKYLDAILSDNDSENLDKLKVLYKVISNNCKILLIKMTDVKDAYKLFQVINDRGRILTPSDLLRASSLGDLDAEEGISDSKMNKLIEAWDDITGLDNVDERLIDYYISASGRRTRRVSLFEDFNKFFFRTSDKIEKNIFAIRDGIRSIEKISNGVWPYEKSSKSLYQKNKLKNLVVTLKHKQAIPLLYTASRNLPEKKFYELLFYMEKFFTLYKVILDKRFDAVSRMYLENIEKINENSDTYQVKSFLAKLKGFLETKTTKSEIYSNLNALEYKHDGDNRLLKLLLLSIEESYDWLKEGCPKGHIGQFKMEEKNISAEMHVYTIEHIYSNSGTFNQELEEKKDTIGNLSLLFDKENVDVDNRDFLDKKPFYEKSRLRISNELKSEDVWDLNAIERRKESIVDRITKVLSLSSNIPE